MNPLLSDWIDARLKQAFDLVEAVQEEQHPGLDVYGILQIVLDKIEDAGCELERLP